MSDKIFVYGTLMRGRVGHHLLGKCRFIGEGRALDVALYQVARWFPGAVVKRGYQVLGELYEVEKDTLTMLDEYEGDLFRRQLLKIKLNDSNLLEAWVYLWLGDVDEAGFIPLERQPWQGD